VALGLCRLPKSVYEVGLVTSAAPYCAQARFYVMLFVRSCTCSNFACSMNGWVDDAGL
jgi:hypothetical protein